MSDVLIESPLVTTIKASDDRDAPWIVIRSKDSQQLQSQLQELENGTVFADIGRVAGVFQAQARLGAMLGAKGIDPQEATGAFEGVTAAKPAASVAVTEPAAAAPAPKAGGFSAFKAAAKPAVAPEATPPPATTARPAADPPPAAPATAVFPAAAAWKKK